MNIEHEMCMEQYEAQKKKGETYILREVYILDKKGEILCSGMYDENRQLIFTANMTCEFLKTVGFSIKEKEDES